MSLRRVEGASISHSPRFFGPGWLVFEVGARSLKVCKMSEDTFDNLMRRQRQWATGICRIGDKQYWMFLDRFYWDNENLQPDEAHALLVTRHERHRQQIDRAQQWVAMDRQPRTPVRGAIPEDVKALVWKRDRGRCRHCGSVDGLEYDHIIPVSKGGSSTENNLQILCRDCNRRKGSSITLR